MESYTISGLSFAYPGQDIKALDNIDLSIPQGQFLVLCGPSGSGKTTLLRQLKPILAPHGEREGEILFEGEPLSGLGRRGQAEKIGFVMQSAENQIVTDKVWHELAFGMESLGLDTPTIRLRASEMATFFGIQSWFNKNTAELSGGQKQLLNLASIMAMQPSVLILDEPTSQLDPIAAAEFLAAVGRINRELGVTVLITEHRLEEVFPLCDRAVVMDGGRIAADGSPQSVGRELKESGHRMFLAMPTPMRVYAAVESDLPCPVTVSEGRRWLDAFLKESGKSPIAVIEEELTADSQEADDGAAAEKDAAVELKELWFKYEKDGPDVIKGLSLTADRGEFLAVIGGNGTGKTTALTLIAGLNRPYRGKVLLEGREIGRAGEMPEGLIGMLPQNPQTLFVKKTVGLDLMEMLAGRGLSEGETEKRLAGAVKICRLGGLLERHPYDLSGGEQQRAALAKVLLLKPRILLMDEPTKGMDAEYKQDFAAILRSLTRQGVTIIMVSHDIEFCAEHARRCALFFDGAIVSEGKSREFFSGNSFYTTSANRMARAHIPDAITTGDVIKACGGELPKVREADIHFEHVTKEQAGKEEKTPDAGGGKRMTRKRKITAFVSAAAFIVTLTLLAGRLAAWGGQMPDMFSLSGLPASEAWLYSGAVILLAAELITFFAALLPAKQEQIRGKKRPLSKRTAAGAVIALLLIPLTIVFGIYCLDDRKYYFISLLIILETMVPFALAFEGRKPMARELIIIAVLCALGVAGRVAFMWLPQFKPVIALVIISGVAFGGETGFLVGAVTGFVSNFFFGQGPWTPWQMFAFGLIGFLAGVFFKNGLLRRGRLPLSIFGALVTVLIYGGLMNPAAVLMFQSQPNAAMITAAYAAGAPFDLIHAMSTAVFLWICSDAMLEKLDRIKAKYGLVE